MQFRQMILLGQLKALRGGTQCHIGKQLPTTQLDQLRQLESVRHMHQLSESLKCREPLHVTAALVSAFWLTARYLLCLCRHRSARIHSAAVALHKFSSGHPWCCNLAVYMKHTSCRNTQRERSSITTTPSKLSFILCENMARKYSEIRGAGRQNETVGGYLHAFHTSTISLTSLQPMQSLSAYQHVYGQDMDNPKT